MSVTNETVAGVRPSSPQERLATVLAKAIKNCRPELVLYLLSDRTAERLANLDPLPRAEELDFVSV